MVWFLFSFFLFVCLVPFSFAKTQLALCQLGFVAGIGNIFAIQCIMFLISFYNVLYEFMHQIRRWCCCWCLSVCCVLVRTLVGVMMTKRSRWRRKERAEENLFNSNDEAGILVFLSFSSHSLGCFFFFLFWFLLFSVLVLSFELRRETWEPKSSTKWHMKQLDNSSTYSNSFVDCSLIYLF